MAHHLPLHPESLLEHGPRLRALARHLVGEGGADDLVQETLVRAVERGPEAGARRWSWLARVLRNLAFQGHRLDAARVARERLTARKEGAGDEGERFALHRELVAAIERLEAPYRQAILLRYFDALPPRKIAARLDVPVKTVKTRLNRGLALLRAELDRTHGGREEWLAAMVPLAGMGGHGLGLGGGLGVALAGSAAVVSAAVYLALPPAGRAARVAEPLTAPATSAVAPALAPAAPPAPAARVPGAASAAAAFTPLPPGPALALTSGQRHGRVLGPDASPLAGVLVGFEPGVTGAPGPVWSDGSGGFELPDLGFEVVSRDERFATVLKSRLAAGARPEEEHVVVVAPAVDLGGVVLDAQGEPAAGLFVRMEFPLAFRGRFREILDGSQEVGWGAQSDAEGRFLIAGAPGLACARLVAWHGHEASAGVPVPEHDAFDLELVLGSSSAPAPGPDALHVVGEVRHAGGGLAPGALVSLAGMSTRADADALFELRVPPAAFGETRRLAAVLPGEEVAFLEPGHDASGAEVWPGFATLWLGGAPRALAGRVLGRDGAPLAGAPVWVADLTFLGGTHDGFLSAEHRMAGKDERERWFSVRSDELGRFELGGLAERAYTLAALDPATLQVVRSQPIPAGTQGVELAFRGDGLFARVAGRVHDTHGQALAGLEVELRRNTFEVWSPEGDLWYGAEERSLLTTDDDGRFEFTDVPREGMRVHVAGTAFAPVDLELEQVADPLDVEVVAPWLGHVQVTVAGNPPAGGSIELRDAQDHSLGFFVFGGGNVWGRDSIALGNPNEFAGGQTPVLSVPETVRSAVLCDAEGAVLRRVPVVVGEELVHVSL